MTLIRLPHFLLWALFTLSSSLCHSSEPIRLGPIEVGGTLRVNYVLGSYQVDDPDQGPNRGGNNGNVELDTAAIKLKLDQNQWLGALEYRWYSDYGKSYPASYSMLHTGWLGYQVNEQQHIEVGVNRVPFGPGPYGVSQSFMFDMHYYLGLSDDMDLGVKYAYKGDQWQWDLAYYLSSEGSYQGRSTDSTRYSFDAVRWRESVSDDGSILYGGTENGFEERNQFNGRAIRSLDLLGAKTQLGASIQWGQLKGQQTDNASHWAASGHMINRWGNLELATQLTRYEYDISANNPWQSDELLPMGAFDFAWFAATQAWLPAASLHYSMDINSLPWLDTLVPYLEYSRVVKDAENANDSEMITLGAQFLRGDWLIYSDLALSNGNYFIGNETNHGSADNYNRIDGVGDWGLNGNDHWNYRLTLNFGYYF